MCFACGQSTAAQQPSTPTADRQGPSHMTAGMHCKRVILLLLGSTECSHADLNKAQKLARLSHPVSTAGQHSQWGCCKTAAPCPKSPTKADQICPCQPCPTDQVLTAITTASAAVGRTAAPMCYSQQSCPNLSVCHPCTAHTQRSQCSCWQDSCTHARLPSKTRPILSLRLMTITRARAAVGKTAARMPNSPIKADQMCLPRPCTVGNQYSRCIYRQGCCTPQQS